MSLIDKLTTAWPLEKWRDVTVLVAVSGGADSVALVRALSQTSVPGDGRLVVAHFNHRLRGDESDADQAFVESLAGELGLKIAIGSPASDLAADHGGEGLEGAARQARYAFLAETSDRVGARYVATAHTADDQVETVLFNLIRGTGLAGLAGIPRIRRLTAAATLVRPLLDVTHGEVLAYLESLGTPFRDDSSNRELDFTRNRIRRRLLPLLQQEFNPHVQDALRRLSQIAGEADALFESQAQGIVARAARPIAGGFEIEASLLKDCRDLVARYCLMSLWSQAGWPQQDMSFDKWEQLLQLVRHANSLTGEQATSSAAGTEPMLRRHFPGGVRAEVQGSIVRLTRSDERVGRPVLQ